MGSPSFPIKWNHRFLGGQINDPWLGTLHSIHPIQLQQLYSSLGPTWPCMLLWQLCKTRNIRCTCGTVGAEVPEHSQEKLTPTLISFVLKHTFFINPNNWGGPWPLLSNPLRVSTFFAKGRTCCRLEILFAHLHEEETTCPWIFYEHIYMWSVIPISICQPFHPIWLPSLSPQ